MGTRALTVWAMVLVGCGSAGPAARVVEVECVSSEPNVRTEVRHSPRYGDEMTTTTTLVYTAELRDPSITPANPPRFTAVGCERIEVGDPLDFMTHLDDEPPTVTESGPPIDVWGTCSTDVVVDVEEGLLRAHCGSAHTTVTVAGASERSLRWQRVRFVF